jgi:undecaprenyl-diphosphatase
MLTGVSRVASAEFSFFMAIPVMLGASLLKIIKFALAGATVSRFEISLLLVAMAVSFVVSLIAIKFLMEFVKKHNFTPFGIYRILLGTVVVGYFIIKSFV